MIHEKTTANAEARKAAHADETPVEPHAHGGDLLRMAEAAGRDPASLLDFSVNVRPEGPPEFIRRALFRAMNALEAYPSPHAEEACRAAARHHGLDAARFVFGNGSNELIHALARALKKRGVPGVYIVEPAFSEYALACRCAGLEVRRVWGGIAGENLGEGRGNLSEERLPTPSKDFYEGKDDQQVPEGTHSGFPQDAPEGWAVFLANPGNPSGLFRNAEDCLDLMRSRHDLLWIIDEAFIEYAGPEEEVSVLRRLPANGAALRSLTKFHAVPGVRLGYLAASPDVAEAVRAEIPAWSVNAFALAAALAVFADRSDFADRTRAENDERRADLAAALAALPGVEVYPSAANYLLFRWPHPIHLGSILLKQFGIALRDCSNYHGLGKGWFRAAVRFPEDHRRLADALRAVLETPAASFLSSNASPDLADRDSIKSKVLGKRGDGGPGEGTTLLQKGFPSPGSRPTPLLPDPDRVFIGGGGKDLPDLLDACMERLKPGGLMVAGSVTLESFCALYGWRPGRRVGLCRLDVANERPIAGTHRHLKHQNTITLFIFQKEIPL